MENFNSPSDVTQQIFLRIVILGHRAENPVNHRQGIEFIAKMIVFWILGSSPRITNMEGFEINRTVVGAGRYPRVLLPGITQIQALWKFAWIPVCAGKTNFGGCSVSKVGHGFAAPSNFLASPQITRQKTKPIHRAPETRKTMPPPMETDAYRAS